MKKTMLRIIPLFLALFSSVQGFAQTTVRGRVVDASTAEPETGAVVQIFEGLPETGSQKGFSVTDSTGVFEVSVKGVSPEAKYSVQVLNLGRKTFVREFSVSGEMVDLGDIPFEDDVESLNSSRVVALKTLVRMDADKLTYDVENDADSKVMTVLEMLRKIPLVTVDAQDNISVNGSSSFKVYVDGRPNQMLSQNASQMFKLMPANNIKSIEVITNPGAKYDAEGTGGILDIKTMTGSGKNTVADGVYGTVSLGTNSLGTKNAGVSINAQKGKWTFGANVNAVGDSNDIDVLMSNTYPGSYSSMESSYSMVQDQKALFGNLSASFEVDSLNLIAASAGVSRLRLNDIYDGGTTSFLVNNSEIYRYTTGSDTDYSMMATTASLDWQHRFKGFEDKMLTLSYQFSGQPVSSDIKTFISDITGPAPVQPGESTTISDDGSYEHTFQLDYATPLAKGHSFNTGLKYIYRHNSADDSYDGVRSLYDYYNHIGAAYTEYSGTFGKFILKGGLRYEYTIQKEEYDASDRNFDVKYGNLVPNASVQWNMSQKGNVSLSYNMRISRPGITYLNPFVDRSNPIAISYGNVDIDAEMSHRLTLAYNYFSPKWVVSLRTGWRFCNNGIEGYSFYDGDIMNSTYGNIVTRSNGGVNWYVNYNASNKTRLYTFADGGYMDIRSTRLDQKNHGWSINGGFGIQQTLPWDIRLSGNLYCTSRNQTLQGWSGGMGFLSLGLHKTFLDDRLTAALQITSNLNNGRLNIKNYSEGATFSSLLDVKVPVRSVGLTLSYTFGRKGGIHVKKTQKTISNDDVVGGAGERNTPGEVESQPAGM